MGISLRAERDPPNDRRRRRRRRSRSHRRRRCCGQPRGTAMMRVFFGGDGEAVSGGEPVCAARYAGDTSTRERARAANRCPRGQRRLPEYLCRSAVVAKFRGKKLKMFNRI